MAKRCGKCEREMLLPLKPECLKAFCMPKIQLNVKVTAMAATSSTTTKGDNDENNKPAKGVSLRVYGFFYKRALFRQNENPSVVVRALIT